MKTLDLLFKILSSLRLTVVCLVAAMVLVFVGTIAQVELGIYAAQAKYFRSFFVWWEVPGTGLNIPVLPGGYLIGSVLLVNLLLAHGGRFGLRSGRIGLMLIHGGLVLLLLGQLATDFLQTESSMRLREGQALNYSQDSRKAELAITDVTDPEQDQVSVIPGRVLLHSERVPVPDTPLSVRVLHYWRNSTNVPPARVTRPSPANRGLGEQVQFAEAPLETNPNRRNVPAAYVEFLGDDTSLGVWLVSEWLDQPQTFTYRERTYQIELRPVRYYKSHYLELLDFTHDKYMGTEIPKNFSSRVRVRRPDTGEDRDVLIYMNHPLRYAGETYYQSGYDERDPRVTILQVVRNPGWLTPYIACAMVGLGLTIQFLQHLFGFARKRRASTSTS